MRESYFKLPLTAADSLAALGPDFARAVEFLRRPDLATLTPGRYEIDGERVYATVAESPLRTVAAARLETHVRYADIQVPLSGEEIFGVAEVDAERSRAAVDAEKDIAFFDDPIIETLTVRPGELSVFLPPTAGHAPCCATTASGTIRKVIVKVLVG